MSELLIPTFFLKKIRNYFRRQREILESSTVLCLINICMTYVAQLNITTNYIVIFFNIKTYMTYMYVLIRCRGFNAL